MPAEQCILGLKIRMALRTDKVGMDKWDKGKGGKRNVVQTLKKVGDSEKGNCINTT